MPDELESEILDSEVMDSFMEAVALKLTPKQFTDKINALFLKQALDLIDNCEVPAKNFVAISKYKAELRAAFQAKYGGKKDEPHTPSRF